MLNIKLTAAARGDLQDGARYYNRQQAGLGRKFEARVKKSFQKIVAMPQAASFVFDDVRYKVVEKFPFIITYVFDDNDVIILRVFNTHLDPGSLT